MVEPNELQREIADLRDHFDERMNATLKWGIMLVIGIAGTLATWEFTQNARISENGIVAERNLDDIRDISRTVRESSNAISTLAAQLESQAQTLRRIDSSLERLTQYLQERQQ